ncbi:polysaccharide deacetylase family protein [Phytohabitans kaempferiae]|uniref:Polysaccharide deacetylase family protein n=1 Tax=Phytohabitans kaempferiae TaxID=1620943 RepID=A0ABV6LZ47_9ACTN
MSTSIDNARVIVAISFDFEAEEDAEYLTADTPDFWDYHERQYGGRRGVWRMLDIFSRYEVNATFFICAALLKSYPRACREIEKGPYEIAAHTIHHEHLDRLTPEAENEMFGHMQRMFGEFYGTAPVGFRTCFPSKHTLDFVADHGFYYDTTTRDDESPYRMHRPGRGSYIEIPRGFNGDAPWVGCPVATPLHTGRYNAAAEVFGAWRDEFDWLYREGEREQKLLTLCLHPYITGRPSRAKAIDNLLAHMAGHDGVYYATHLEVAQYFDRRSGTPAEAR